MNCKRSAWLCLLAAAPSVPAIAAAPQCATCSREVALAKDDVQCVLERVSKQLSRSLDPVVVATQGCRTKVRDGTRLEPVRQGRASAKSKGQASGEPYLLTKQDAQCLLARLRAVDAKVRDLRIDLRDCR